VYLFKPKASIPLILDKYLNCNDYVINLVYQFFPPIDDATSLTSV